MAKLKHHILIPFIWVLLVITSNTYGQSHHDSDGQKHEFKRFRMAINLGHAYIPSASIGKDRDFAVIPVWGFDFQYWFSPKWGLALKNDIEIAKYTIDNSDAHSDDLERTNPIIVSLPVLFSPWNNGLTFLLGPGIELEGHQNFSIFRFGLGYEFEFGNHWDFAPEIVYDLKDGHINSLTIAIGVGKRF